jgi:MarR family transcriptional regulator for hemolysin
VSADFNRGRQGRGTPDERRPPMLGRGPHKVAGLDLRRRVPMHRPNQSLASRDALERLANAQRRLVQDVATRHGLSHLQVQILALLYGDPPPEHRGGGFSRELGISAPTVSDAIAALRAKNLVEHAPDGTDRRARTLTLTSAGQELAGRRTTRPA